MLFLFLFKWCFVWLKINILGIKKIDAIVNWCDIFFVQRVFLHSEQKICKTYHFYVLVLIRKHTNQSNEIYGMHRTWYWLWLKQNICSPSYLCCINPILFHSSLGLTHCVVVSIVFHISIHLYACLVIKHIITLQLKIQNF